MKRPQCPACQQRPCAINYLSEHRVHYRSRCEVCIRKGRRIKPPVPRWQQAGYRKKNICDRCGFKSKFSAQLVVCHVDGNLHNSDFRNLKTICQNCVIEVNRLDLPWRAGDLEPDH